MADWLFTNGLLLATCFSNCRYSLCFYCKTGENLLFEGR